MSTLYYAIVHKATNRYHGYCVADLVHAYVGSHVGMYVLIPFECSGHIYSESARDKARRVSSALIPFLGGFGYVM